MTYDSRISIGPVSGLSGLAAELMMFLGHYPDEHPDVALKLRLALEDETLQLGRDILAEHGLTERDSVGLGSCLPTPMSTEDDAPSEYALWKQGRAA